MLFDRGAASGFIVGMRIKDCVQRQSLCKRLIGVDCGGSRTHLQEFTKCGCSSAALLRQPNAHIADNGTVEFNKTRSENFLNSIAFPF
jgi:hypothetical protein